MNVQFNVRVPQEKIDALKVVAEVEDITPRDLVLEAIDLIIERRRADPGWLARLDEREASMRQAFDRLREGEVGNVTCGWIVWGPMRAICAACATQNEIENLHPDWRVVPVLGVEAEGVYCERCGRELSHVLEDA